jgi:hypothetical protein
MLSLRLCALGIIPRQPRNRTANRPANTILHALTQIRQLALRLLPLPLLVLANALLLEALGADKSTYRLLQRTDVLVPATGATVRVVFCDAARGGGGEGASLCGGVREVFLSGGLGLAVLALRLQGSDEWCCGGREEHTLSAVLPVSEPTALWMAPVAWSRYD